MLLDDDKAAPGTSKSIVGHVITGNKYKNKRDYRRVVFCFLLTTSTVVLNTTVLFCQ